VPAYDRDVTWAPDGQRLAFIEVLDTLLTGDDVYTVGPDGKGLRSEPGGGGLPYSVRWSLDGRKLLYEVLLDGEGSTALSLGRLGSGEARELAPQRSLPNGFNLAGLSAGTHIWSPDRTSICVSAMSEDSDDWQLYLVRADGGGFARLTSVSGFA